MAEDDLSYDELAYEEAPAGVSSVLTGLVVLLIAVLGAPQVWDALRSGDFRPALVFYPVLGAAFGYLAVRGRTR
jgi:formate hydrogenlyase subunit 3/multisubunit Na+/H+ antiporter MnhD subunit